MSGIRIVESDKDRDPMFLGIIETGHFYVQNKSAVGVVRGCSDEQDIYIEVRKCPAGFLIISLF